MLSEVVLVCVVFVGHFVCVCVLFVNFGFGLLWGALCCVGRLIFDFAWRCVFVCVCAVQCGCYFVWPCLMRFLRVTGVYFLAMFSCSMFELVFCGCF